jgi:hypothetical protein
MALWAVGVVAVYLVRRPRRPDPTTPTPELGAEPPAVVNLLTHRFRVTGEAAPATLIDLAARGALSIDDVGDNEYVCRLRRDAAHTETAYERRIVEHLRDRAVDSVVPARALTFSPPEATRWWRDFRREVVEEAQRRGLCRDLWDRTASGIFFLLPCVSFVLLEASIGFRDPEEVDQSTVFTLGLVAVVIMGVIGGGLIASRRQRSTPDGEKAANQWAGVHEYLRSAGTFADLPSAAVAVWDRYLAYAGAMGEAPAATESLGLGVGDDRRAWSSYTGQWREVRVGYPRWRPGWGRSSVAAFVLSLLWGVPAAFLLRVLVGTGRIESTDLLPIEAARWFERARIGGIVLSVIILAWAVVQLGGAFADLAGTRSLQGQVLRTRAKVALPRLWGDNKNRRRWFVAVDDGSSDAVKAWSVSRAVFDSVSEGDVVRVSLRPGLAHVEAMVPSG